MNKVKIQNLQLNPSKIVCVGRNYAEHVAELNNETPQQAVIFAKPNSAISEHLSLGSSDDIHYEAEISLLVHQGQYVAVSFGLDLTKRGLQTQLKNKGLPWERAKAFDGSAVFSRFVPLSGELASLRLELWIDGALRQHGSYQQMIYKPEFLLEEIRSFMTLYDGDIIMTGTPAGVDKIKLGQHFHGKVFAGDDLLVEQEWLATV